jgi:hypothetical protein
MTALADNDSYRDAAIFGAGRKPKSGSQPSDATASETELAASIFIAPQQPVRRFCVKLLPRHYVSIDRA